MKNLENLEFSADSIKFVKEESYQESLTKEAATSSNIFNDIYSGILNELYWLGWTFRARAYQLKRMYKRELDEDSLYFSFMH